MPLRVRATNKWMPGGCPLFIAKIYCEIISSPHDNRAAERVDVLVQRIQDDLLEVV